MPAATCSAEGLDDPALVGPDLVNKLVQRCGDDPVAIGSAASSMRPQQISMIDATLQERYGSGASARFDGKVASSQPKPPPPVPQGPAPLADDEDDCPSTDYDYPPELPLMNAQPERRDEPRVGTCSWNAQQRELKLEDQLEALRLRSEVGIESRLLSDQLGRDLTDEEQEHMGALISDRVQAQRELERYQRFHAMDSRHAWEEQIAESRGMDVVKYADAKDDNRYAPMGGPDPRLANPLDLIGGWARQTVERSTEVRDEQMEQGNVFGATFGAVPYTLADQTVEGIEQNLDRVTDGLANLMDPETASRGEGALQMALGLGGAVLDAYGPADFLAGGFEGLGGDGFGPTGLAPAIADGGAYAGTGGAMLGPSPLSMTGIAMSVLNDSGSKLDPARAEAFSEEVASEEAEEAEEEAALKADQAPLMKPSVARGQEGLTLLPPDKGQQQGREGRLETLELQMYDQKQPSWVRGWLRNEWRRVERGDAQYPRTPPGRVLAHGRDTPAREGFDYSNSRLQDEGLNKLEERVRRRAGRP